MQIETVKLNYKNKLMKNYQAKDKSIMQFFDYDPDVDYEKRIKDIQDRQFDRNELTNTLLSMNEEWDAPETTLTNIKKITDEQAVAVIGGQQAGLLTGPMYTVNKIISIIQFAKQQEKLLNVPVIPVFWIAGEDHDFDEINHTYLFDLPEMKKHTLTHPLHEKQPISKIKMDSPAVKQWLQELFHQLQETEITKDLYQTIVDCLQQSTTYVDFFARLLFALFSDEGLVLVDSNHEQIRQIESEYFIKLITHQEQIAEGIYLTAQQMRQAGYSLSLDVEKDDAHFFFHHQSERVLLKRTEDGKWQGKQHEIELTTDELIKIATDTPQLLSNNVVTRPLMQEMLFPTLAFIGGWGEISYWAVLKRAFNTLGMTMPPVVPRLSISYINKKTVETMEEYGMDYEEVINEGVKERKANWLATMYNPPVDQLANQIKTDITAIHQPLRSIAKQIRQDVGDLADKNVYYLQKEIDFLAQKMTQTIHEKHQREMDQFDLIQQILRPNGGLQERTWNPVYLINETNINFVKRVIQKPLSFNQDHYAVIL